MSSNDSSQVKKESAQNDPKKDQIPEIKVVPLEQRIKTFLLNLVNEQMFWRVFIFGSISCALMYYLYNWAEVLRWDHCYTRNIYPLEYQEFPSFTEVDKTLMKYGYEAHNSMAVMALIGTFNIFFYSMFYCDLLTLTLPTKLQKLDLFPFLVGLIDFAENVVHFIILLTYPEQSLAWNAFGYLVYAKNITSQILYGLIIFGVISCLLSLLFVTSKPADTTTEKKNQ